MTDLLQYVDRKNFDATVQRMSAHHLDIDAVMFYLAPLVEDADMTRYNRTLRRATNREMGETLDALVGKFYDGRQGLDGCNCGCDDCADFHGYEEAPSTKMLATHCAVCGRPLRDAISVSVGMGPDCRERHGYNAEVDPIARAEANKIIHWVAVKQHGYDVLVAAKRLREIGFPRIAEIISERASDVFIEDAGRVIGINIYQGRTFELDDSGYKVSWKYNPDVTMSPREVPGRVWLGRYQGPGLDPKGEKAWFVPYRSKRELHNFLARNFAGKAVMGPKGPYEQKSL